MSSIDNRLTTKLPIKDQNGRVIGHKEVALYAGLLAKAHAEGLKAIKTALLYFPDEKTGHVAVVHATVETQKGIFTGIGDASPENVNRRIAPHIIRMAETRAKARALRDAVNIGVVALEELDELLPEDGEQAPQEPGNGIQEPENNKPGNGRSEPAASQPPQTGEAMTVPQRRMLLRLLAERGFRGRQAEDELCRMMGLASIESATKRQASTAIEQLQGNGGSGRPTAA